MQDTKPAIGKKEGEVVKRGITGKRVRLGLMQRRSADQINTRAMYL